jgi:hypothetical protein
MKRCKICKNKFEPRFNTLERVCWDLECKASEAMQILRKIKDIEAKNQRKRLQSMKNDLMTIQQWVKKTQAIFNQYIRLRDDKRGCISCGVSLQGKKFDAGHFYNANNHWGLRFDESNVHGQCVRCNRDFHGNLLEYRKRIIQRIGTNELDRLDAEANITRKFNRDELLEIYTKYKAKCRLYQKID